MGAQPVEEALEDGSMSVALRSGVSWPHVLEQVFRIEGINAFREESDGGIHNGVVPLILLQDVFAACAEYKVTLKHERKTV